MMFHGEQKSASAQMCRGAFSYQFIGDFIRLLVVIFHQFVLAQDLLEVHVVCVCISVVSGDLAFHDSLDNSITLHFGNALHDHILRLRSVYKKLHSDHETGAADNK